NFWVLIAHIAYFIVGTILIYTMQITTDGDLTIIEGTMMWATLLGVHAFGYFFYYYIDSIEGVTKGLIVHIAFYAAIIGWLIYAYTKVQEGIFYPLYPMILWGILIAFHSFISIKWDDILKGSLEMIERQFGGLDKYELRAKAKRLFFWQWSLMAHIAIYAVGLVLIGITMAIESVNIALLIHPAMGWGIAIAIHSSFYIIHLKNIQGFWKGTFAIHLATYISVGIYLIILNAMIGGYPFSAIALVGWGIGLGIHYIIAYVR
ncbi:MAG: 2TM domain-containing protein, partial [Promethearchaeota archaeon]